jgi:hypothetical protein
LANAVDFAFVANMVEHRPHPQQLGPIMEQLRPLQKDDVAGNDGMDMFEQAGVARE